MTTWQIIQDGGDFYATPTGEETPPLIACYISPVNTVAEAQAARDWFLSLIADGVEVEFV